MIAHDDKDATATVGLAGATEPPGPASAAEAEAILQSMASAFFLPTADAPRASRATPSAEREARSRFVDEATVVLGPTGMLEDANAAAEQLFGWPVSELRGRGLETLLAQTGRGAPFEVTAGRLVVREEALGRRRDGSTFPLELSTSHLTIGGEPRIVLVVRDLGERLRAEEQLAKSQARYKMLVEQIPAVTFMAALDEGLNEIYIGPQIEALLGFTQKEWLDSPVLWYWQLHPEDRARWNEEFARGCATGGPFRSECRFMARDGHIVWVHGEARVVRDEDGRPLFVQGVAFDITESKRAEEKVREAQDALIRNEKLAAIGQLAGAVAHDLRNPLAAIRNAWYFVNRKISVVEHLKTEPRFAQMSGLIDSELLRCGKIIGDLLDFARAREPFRVPCPVDELLQSAVSVVVKPHGATIEVLEEVPAGMPTPYLDSDHFRQLLVNLLQNAVEAVDPVKGRVVARARADGSWLVLEVADNGKGIPPEVRKRLFEPLFTTKTRGTGLGLAISEGVVRRHGGTIICDSAPGKGTTFIVRVPFGEPSRGETPLAGGAADMRIAPAAGGTPP